jgi:hypothetical protein
MSKYCQLIIIIILFTTLLSGKSNACTTAVISGKCTVDGRPLLYKHRDSGYNQNKLKYFKDGKYTYIGLVNSVDTSAREVWAGSNSTGFAIMNSASYNINIDDTTRLKDQEGIIMKEALRNCATLKDFEELLHAWPKPMGVEANFGVIDANGGAAYYETSNFGFKKIDANDPSIAPFGYVIRTNYSFSGTNDDGYGYIRYATANKLIYDAIGQNTLDYKFLIQNVSRSLKHSLLDLDLKEMTLKGQEEKQFVFFEDYIPRQSTVAVMVVQGIKKNELPELTTIWTILGFPLCSVALPVWVNGGSELPVILIADDSGNAPLCQLALNLKNKCFPIKRGSGKRYLNLAALRNRNETGILQQLPKLENEIFRKTENFLSRWRKSGMEDHDVVEIYTNFSEVVSSFYAKQFK